MVDKLKYRHEEKYMINNNDYLALKNRLNSILNQDNNADDGQYRISSLYFDDLKNTALFEKLSGVNDRKKYRIRIYNKSTNYIVLEKKIKKMKYTAKKRQEITKEEYNKIITLQTNVLIQNSKPLLRELGLQMKNNLLKPVIIVDYVREAYVSKPGNVRVTFDKHLKTGLNNTELLRKELPMVETLEKDKFILEVKYDKFLPGHVKAVIQLDGRYKQSISKYTMCRKYIKKNRWEVQ